MRGVLDLNQLGVRFTLGDTVLMSLLKRRMDLAVEVGRNKAWNNEPVENLGREEKRVGDARGWAKRHSLDQDFAESMLRMTIGESRRIQKEQRAHLRRSDLKDPKTESGWRRKLRKSLLELTRLCSEDYDDQYAKESFAVRAYLEYEWELLNREIGLLPHCGRVLDLGCATGRLAFKLESRFERTVGYDVSEDMVRRAVFNLRDRLTSSTYFKQADLERGIPEETSTVSLVAMNLGTAGDVYNITKVLRDTQRVLEKGGRFFFSFYNKDALIYLWDYIPWPAGLVASINPQKHYLEVLFQNKLFPIYARPYTTAEVVDLFSAQKGLEVTETSTYPTVSSILPNDLFESDQASQSVVTTLDRTLTQEGRGAYITVTGFKK